MPSLSQRIKKFSARERAHLGLSDFDDCVRDSRLPDPLEFNADFPVLSGLNPIEPVASLEELIREINEFVDFEPPPEQYYRVIEGVFRFRGARLKRFQEETDTTIMQLEFKNVLDRDIRDPNPVKAHALASLFFDIEPEWLYVEEQRRRETKEHYFAQKNNKRTPLTVRWFREMQRAAQLEATSRLSDLIGELVEKFKRNEGGPILSLPTHQGGWLDPLVLMERLVELKRLKITPGRFDLIHALLRLAPDHRVEALKLVKGIHPSLKALLRYALGKTVKPEVNTLATVETWLAAGRSRSPNTELDELRELDIDANLPDGIESASYSFNPEYDPARIKKRLNTLGLFAAMLHAKAMNEGVSDDLLRIHYAEVEKEEKKKIAKTTCLINRPIVADLETDQFFPTVYLTQICEPNTISHTIWPARPEACLVEFCEGMWKWIDNGSERWDGPRNFPELLSPLSNPDRNWSELGRAALWIGLCSNYRKIRTSSVEILQAGIADGRANARALGETLTLINAKNYLKLIRIHKGLKEIIRKSSHAKWVVSEIIDVFLSSCGKMSKDSVYLLELKQQLLSHLKLAPSTKLKAKLSKIKGASKTAR